MSPLKLVMYNQSGLASERSEAVRFLYLLATPKQVMVVALAVFESNIITEVPV